MTVTEFVALLDNAKPSGEGWMAKCPAHEDRTASLSVGGGTDGRILICCFAGCSVYEITSALGVELSELFPPKVETFRPAGRKPKHHPMDLLKVLATEALICQVASSVLASGNELGPRDLVRLKLAEERIARVREAFP